MASTGAMIERIPYLWLLTRRFSFDRRNNIVIIMSPKDRHPLLSPSKYELT